MVLARVILDGAVWVSRHFVVSGEMCPGAVSLRPRVRANKKLEEKPYVQRHPWKFFFVAQDVSQPQPAKVVILSQRGQEKSAKDTILRRRVLEGPGTQEGQGL